MTPHTWDYTEGPKRPHLDYILKDQRGSVTNTWDYTEKSKRIGDLHMELH